MDLKLGELIIRKTLFACWGYVLGLSELRRIHTKKPAVIYEEKYKSVYTNKS